MSDAAALIDAAIEREVGEPSRRPPDPRHWGRALEQSIDAQTAVLEQGRGIELGL